MRTLFFVLALAAASDFTYCQASDLHVGSVASVATSSADHSKTALWLGYEGRLLNRPLSVHLDLPVYSFPLATATSNPEIHESSFPFYGRVFSEFRYFGLGIQRYFTELGATSRVPVAVSIFFRHELHLAESLDLFGLLGAGVQLNPVKTPTFLASPEVSLNYGKKVQVSAVASATWTFASNDHSPHIICPRGSIQLGIPL